MRRKRAPSEAPSQTCSLDTDFTTHSGRASVPHVLITVALESRPVVAVACLHEGDERWLMAWIRANAAYRELLEAAFDLAEGERAA